MIAWLLACGLSLTRDAGNSSSPFPHPDGYDESHGLDSTRFECTGCHALRAADATASSSTTAPACDSCHAAWPHDAGWDHGAAWLADATQCTGCHGTAGDSWPANASVGRCVSCHATYPHAEAWEEPTGHGAAVIARGSDTACEGCHGADGAAVADAACSDCHALYPHAAGWLLEGHGSTWRSSTEEPRCGESCHPATADDQHLSCASCHDLWPHPADIRNNHIGLAQARSSATCMACHAGGDVPGPSLPAACGGACHAGSAVRAR